MGLITDGITNYIQRALAPKATLPVVGGGTVVFTENRAVKANVGTYRHWARYSPWVRAAINIRKDQIASADYEIGPYNETKPYSKRLAAHIKSIFDSPNPRDRSFRAFVTPILDDLLTLDGGSVEIVGSLMEPVRYLYPVDSEWVRVARHWTGIDAAEPRYFWYPNNSNSHSAWRNADFIYLMTNPVTYSPLGISPLEVLRLSVEAQLAGSEYNRRQVQSAVPEGLLHLGEGVPGEKVDQFRTFMAQEVLGKGAMAITGGGKEPKWFSFRHTNRDMQFAEWMRFIITEVAVVYGLSIQDFQQLFDINRSTGETQAQLSEDRGLRPLADLVQDEFTQQVVWHKSFGGPDNNLAFRFTRLKIKESYDKAQINKIAMAGVPWLTMNMVLIDSGREPVGDVNDPNNAFNQRIANTPLGMVRLTENPEDIPTPAEMAGLKAAKGAALTSPNGTTPPAAGNGAKPPAAGDATAAPKKGYRGYSEDDA